MCPIRRRSSCKDIDSQSYGTNLHNEEADPINQYPFSLEA